MDEAVVSKPMADQVMESHGDLVGALEKWKRIHGDVSTRLRENTALTEDEMQGEAGWARVVSSLVADYPDVAAQTSRFEAASLATLQPLLPQGWSALISGADLMGTHRAGDMIEIALLTGDSWEPQRSEQLKHLRNAVKQMYSLGDSDTSITPASEGVSPKLLINVAGRSGDQRCSILIPPFTSEAVLAESILRTREAGIGCVRMTENGQRVICFDSPALAAIAMNGIFTDPAYLFAQTPISLSRQPICLTYAESLGGGASIPYRSALLLRHYVQGSSLHLSAARLLLHWKKHHQLTYVSDYALLVLFAHYLLLTGQSVFLEPITVAPLDVAQALSAPEVDNKTVSDIAQICKSFFAFFTAFNWVDHAVAIDVVMFVDKKDLCDVVAEKKTLLRQASEHTHSEMWICDPFTRANLMKNVSGVKATHLKGLFAACAVLLKKGCLNEVFGYDIGRSTLTLTSNIDDLFISICGNVEGTDVTNECFVEVSSDGQSHAAVQAAPVPPSPSYAPRTIKAANGQQSIKNLLALQGIWNESPSLDAASSPGTPSPVHTGPRKGGAAAGEDLSMLLHLGGIYIAIFGGEKKPQLISGGSFISVDADGNGKPHVALFRRCGVVTTPMYVTTESPVFVSMYFFPPNTLPNTLQLCLSPATVVVTMRNVSLLLLEQLLWVPQRKVPSSSA